MSGLIPVQVASTYKIGLLNRMCKLALPIDKMFNLPPKMSFWGQFYRIFLPHNCFVTVIHRDHSIHLEIAWMRQNTWMALVYNGIIKLVAWIKSRLLPRIICKTQKHLKLFPIIIKLEGIYKSYKNAKLDGLGAETKLSIKVEGSTSALIEITLIKLNNVS